MKIKAIVINGSLSTPDKKYVEGDIVNLQEKIFDAYSRAGIVKMYIAPKVQEKKLTKVVKSKYKK